MERNEQLHEEAEETLDQINKKTGRNMPQAIVATGAVPVIQNLDQTSAML